MLLLTRIRLVNWHFFDDCFIDINQMTLLAGDNGTGKSTIIDAIQYALVANIRKIRFNAAAADRRSGRTLESYCRCKIGSESQEYMRDDCVSHVMLEFSRGDRSFCAGIMVESYREGRDTGEHPWVFENARLDEIMISEGVRYRNPSEFKQYLKSAGGTVCSTKRDYSSRLTHLLGVHRRNMEFNPYLETLVRSVNFTPFSSVDRFVCNYILEERQVDISIMRENLQNYREAERQAKQIEKSIVSLGAIEAKEKEYDLAREQITLQELLLRKIDVDICDMKKAAEQSLCDHRRDQLGMLAGNISFLKEDIERKNGNLQEMRIALASNDKHRLWESLDKELGETRRKIEGEKQRHERKLLLQEQVDALLGRKTGSDINAEIGRCTAERDEAQKGKYSAENRAAEREAELDDAARELEDLRRGTLRYPESSVTLRDELAKNGIEAWIFAELLEVTDEAWQNALEGWLNTQRFNILVPETDFQRALDIYNGLPKNIHGVGLPDLVKMKESEVRPGSLAEIVKTASPYARRYAAYLLGEVMMATLGNLREHRRAVTRECMRYSGFTASRISPEVYSKWYIGKKAREIRMRDLDKRMAELMDEIKELKSRLRSLEERMDILQRAIHTLYDINTLTDAEERIYALDKVESELSARLGEIDASEFIEIERSIGALSREIEGDRNELEGLQKKTGELETLINTSLAKIETLTERRREFLRNFDEFMNERRAVKEQFDRYYRERTGDKNPEEVKGAYERNKKGNETRAFNLSKELNRMKIDYNREHNTYLSPDEDSTAFRDLLKKYRETELPSYREKIEKARNDAEKQFKEHFVTRLNEYIVEARQSFDEINQTLRVIRFGSDQYRFSLEEKSEKRKIHHVIKTAAGIAENEGTLWQQLTTDEDRDTVDRLFRSVLENDLDSPAVRELCDYREYFTYDIKITHTDNIDSRTGKAHVSSLSRVLREKSGGETQTPYYVAIAASFYRFFKDDPAATRLVLFDEAFNKMDDDRIGKTIDFFKKMGIQIVTAVPTEKIEPIAPFMDQTNLVIRHNYNAYVRDYGIVNEDA